MYATEEQQIELLKRLWKEYGVPTLVGVVIAMIMVFGWRFYQQYKTRRAEVASVYYSQLLIQEMNQQINDAATQADVLKKQYADTPYATLAAFLLAKNDVANSKLPQAAQELQWVIDHGSVKTFKQIARLRLARVLLAQQQAEKALQALSAIRDKSLVSLVWATKGDAYRQMGKTEEARVAYQNALRSLPNATLIQPAWQMKLEALPVSEDRGRKTENR
jgi:predicted negative regulator of RcsB-dependent stress response